MKTPAGAELVVAPGTTEERVVPILDRVFVGRECDGVDDAHRVLIDDAAVSRHHLEIRLDDEQDRAAVVDLSTNGTRLNGVRIERGLTVPLRPGDRLTVGGTDLEFRSTAFGRASWPDLRGTVRHVTTAPMVLVVGDVIGYSTISERTTSDELLTGLDTLFAELRPLLGRARGTLTNYVGDAFFAAWELDMQPDAAERAVSFALDAHERVGAITPAIGLRSAAGRPIEMGWAVALGDAASSLTGGLVTVVGDAANVAFRVAGLAGRDGWPPVLVTDVVAERAGERFSFGDPTPVAVRGRTGAVAVRPVLRSV